MDDLKIPALFNVFKFLNTKEGTDSSQAVTSVFREQPTSLFPHSETTYVAI